MTKVITPHDKLMQQEEFLGVISYTHYIDEAEIAKDAGWAHWYRGVPVTVKLQKYLLALEKKLPSGMIIMLHDPASHNEKDVKVWNKLHITYCGFECLYVGSVECATTGKFVVQSPCIVNNQCNKNSQGYRQKKSSDMEKAVKIATQYLRPPVVDDVIATANKHLERHIINVQSQAQHKLSNVVQFNPDTLTREVQHMMRAGYTPVTEEFRKAIDFMLKEANETKRTANYKPNASFVWVGPEYIVYCPAASGQRHELKSAAELPEEVCNKMAVLDIAKLHDVIIDVGVRTSNNVYWIFV